MRLKQCIVANETPIDQQNVHHIDNSTVNNDTSDSTIDNDTNNQLENEKILKTLTIHIPIPKHQQQQKLKSSKTASHKMRFKALKTLIMSTLIPKHPHL